MLLESLWIPDSILSPEKEARMSNDDTLRNISAKRWNVRMQGPCSPVGVKHVAHVTSPR